MNYSANQVWFGSAIKVGGMLGPVGFETLVGSICRVDELAVASNYWAFGATPGVRLGLGLGGSVGLTVVIVIGTQFFIDLHNLDIGGPGINIAIDDKLGNLGSALKVSKAEFDALKTYVGVAKNGSKLATIREGTIMNIVNNIMNGISSANGSVPVGFALDVPFAGAGLELSAFWTVAYKLELNGL